VGQSGTDIPTPLLVTSPPMHTNPNVARATKAANRNSQTGWEG